MTKIKSLESLRGLCAIIVALYHFGFTSTSILTNNLFIKNGFYFVDFFFVLSGFVIYKNYINYFTSFKNIYTFQLKRFFRLYPLHIFILFFFVLIELLKLLLQLKFNLVANNPAFSSNDLKALLNNIFLTHGFLENAVTFNSPSWSISTEFFTYLIFALIAFFAQKNYIKISILLIFISGFILYLKSGHQATAGYLAITRCIYAFFLGSLINILIKKDKYFNNIFLFLFLPILLLIICSIKLEFEFLLPICFSIFIYLILMSKNNFILKFLNSNYLVFLGKISYSIYMIHSLVWWCIRQTLRFVFKIENNDIDGNVLLILDNNQSLISIIIGMVITILLASLLFKYIEKPFINYAKKKFI